MTKSFPRADVKTRMKALESGMWQTHDGRWIALTQMVDDHLVNALLYALEQGEPAGVTTPLAREVHRRGLDDYAIDIAKKRLDARPKP